MLISNYICLVNFYDPKAQLQISSVSWLAVLEPRTMLLLKGYFIQRSINQISSDLHISLESLMPGLIPISWSMFRNSQWNPGNLGTIHINRVFLQFSSCEIEAWKYSLSPSFQEHTARIKWGLSLRAQCWNLCSWIFSSTISLVGSSAPSASMWITPSYTVQSTHLRDGMPSRETSGTVTRNISWGSTNPGARFCTWVVATPTIKTRWGMKG